MNAKELVDQLYHEMISGQLVATTILDRLLHHCHMLSITGDSYRVKGSKLNVKKSILCDSKNA
ncbi:hypothetical protein INP51_15890 [Blautia liquoris]|uniref:IstB-like ATP-binding domain-containing protein n=1 Tax=Blautia liquoris TaxID=2779518 RepID=A0A7M2RIM1_9FIRM|nr:ATP-binding protein [Blautia liquoris]QOV19387.1 hypothetical protein INP51_15890 [Blautia liquoris]